MARTPLMLDKLAPSAKILDGILVLTLPDALRPIVWQMELGQTKSSAMEVREQEGGTYLLVLKTPRQDVVEIAPYDSREKAVRALITISKALEAAQGQLRAAAANANQYLPAVIPQGGPSRLKLGRIAIGIAVVAALVFFLTRIDHPGPGAAAVSPAAGPATAETGEPLSADDFLNSQ